MILAGLHIGHDANATIMVDGEIRVVVEAERVLDEKHVTGLDAALAALSAALEFCDRSPSDIESICISDDLTPRLSMEVGHPKIKAATHARPYVVCLEQESGVFADLTERFVGTPLYICCHGLAHAAAGIYMSGFSDCQAVVYDGHGSCSASLTARYDGNSLALDEAWSNSLMMGHRYSQFGYFLNDLHRDIAVGNGQLMVRNVLDFAGKIMGLHAYGTALEQDVRDLEEWFRHPDVNLYLSCYSEPSPAPVVGLRPGNVYHSLRLDCLKSSDPRSRDIIAAMQEAFSRVAVAEIGRAMARGGAERLVLSGGCALNIVTNERVAKMSEVRELFVPPNCDDRGISMGAALLLDSALTGVPLHRPNVDLARRRSPYQGLPVARDVAVPPDGVSAMAFPLSERDNLDAMARWLASDRIVGMVHGRGEIGPRALGHRSILASPARVEMKDTINQRIKHREWWRPFAPVVRSIDLDRYFDVSRHDPYMLTGGLVRPEFRDRLAAITHIDGTARVQSLPDRAANPELWDLLTALAGLTGIGILLNTSYNAGGKPLAHRTSSAFALLRETGLDALWMDGTVYWKATAEGFAPQ